VFGRFPPLVLVILAKFLVVPKFDSILLLGAVPSVRFCFPQPGAALFCQWVCVFFLAVGLQPSPPTPPVEFFRVVRLPPSDKILTSFFFSFQTLDRREFFRVRQPVRRVCAPAPAYCLLPGSFHSLQDEFAFCNPFVVLMMLDNEKTDNSFCPDSAHILRFPFQRARGLLDPFGV